MLLKALGTAGAVSGTGTLTCETRIMGGVLISTNGTNAATVIVRKDNGSGDQIFDLSTLSTIFVAGPFHLGTTALYYDVSGTGASAQFYEWVE